jgi:hypothetical protein
VDTVIREAEALEQMGANCVIGFATFAGYAPMKMLPTWLTPAEQVMPRCRGARAMV